MLDKKANPKYLLSAVLTLALALTLFTAFPATATAGTETIITAETIEGVTSPADGATPSTDTDDGANNASGLAATDEEPPLEDPENVTGVTPEMPVNPFTDVSGSDWFIDAVIYVYNNGLMNGTCADPIQFSSDLNVTRGMVVTALYRHANSPSIDGQASPFGDVAESEYYTAAVTWAAANGIVKGYGGGNFGPDDNVTREQLATILNNYTGFAGINLRETRQIVIFNDDNDIADYAKESVARLVRANVITGKPGNIFDPQGLATRAEFAAMLQRMLAPATLTTN